MSDIMEQTISSIPGLITGQRKSSRAFQNFVKNLGMIKFKYEEEMFVKREIAFQRRRLTQPGITPFQMREYLVRLLYCHMLGHDVSFGFIHAVKIAQQGNLLVKRAGYVLCSLFLSCETDLVILLINTLQKDLQSSNIIDVCTALTAAGNVVSAEMIPALLPSVQGKLTHDREIVRKKAVLCLHQFYHKAPETMENSSMFFQKALCDPEPGVMWAALHYFHDVVQVNPGGRGDLVQTLTAILDQIQNQRLPADYEYHSCPAPWLQMLIMKTLAFMGHGNREQSLLMYDVLSDVLKKTDPSHKIGLSVIYECVQTVLYIWPYPVLLEQVSKCVGRFLSATSNNLKCLGLQSLSLMMQTNSEYALQQQETVLQCLENQDVTIRVRALELLFHMANKDNMRVICAKLIDHLALTDDEVIRTDIISKVLLLTDKFAKDRIWYIETVMRVLLLAGDKCVPDNIMKQVIDQIQTDDEESSEVQQAAVKICFDLLQKTVLPKAVLEISVWIVGHYGHLDLNTPGAEKMHLLTSWYCKPMTGGDFQCQVVEAVTKLAYLHPVPAKILEDLQKFATQGDMHLKQRLRELRNLQKVEDKDALKNLVLKPLSIEEMDFSLSFLDEYVAQALERGSEPYLPPSLRQHSSTQVLEHSPSVSEKLKMLPEEVT